MIPRSYYSPLFFLLALKALAAPLHALPDVKFDKSKSLGTWQQFVTSLGLQKKPGADIYFDTDRLVVGEFERKSSYSSDFAPENRRQIRTGVGRLVKQTGGPDIVVYDFDEIYTAVGPSASIKLPATIYLFGRRPAAIVADGQISNWPYENGEQTFDIYAYNSCDPDNTNLRAPAGIGRGGDGSWRRTSTDPSTYSDHISQGGGGGYGTAGERGSDDTVAPGGLGGRTSFSWNVLRPGSPGGGAYEVTEAGPTLRQHSGGLGGGAVWIKSGGRLDLGNITADGRGDRADLASGSGGHVVMESSETPQIGSIRVAGSFSGVEARGPGSGGAGVLEFRGTPRPPKLAYLLGNYPYATGLAKAPVGLPTGVTSLQNPNQEVSGTEWPTGWNPDSKEPEYQIVPRPRSPVPAVTASAPRRMINAQKFGVAASVTTGRNAPAALRLRYRVRPPGATFFGSWITELLPAGSTRNKSWKKEVISSKQGRWQVEVVADDAKGGRSTGKVVEVLVDRIKPQCFTPTNGAVQPTGKPGSYQVKVYADDDDSAGVGTDASGPARVEYRLKRPGAKPFGNWQRVAVGAPGQHTDWPYVQLTIPVTLDRSVRGEWTMEVRAVDRAGNISNPDRLKIKQ